MLLHKIRGLYYPERYHGWNKRRNFFEGWYYKLIDHTEQYAIAIIPGIAIADSQNQHSFIQVLDGKKHTASYHKFDANAFTAKSDSFDISIADNHFRREQLNINLPDLKGELQFKNQVPWPSSILSPGIMGPFSYVPFMQCYHGILSMDHSIEGSLQFKDRNIDFSGGRGYMEKDWGHSFPSAYFWMQSNHFSKSGISIKASVAKIPWLGSSFVGFIAGVWLEDHLIQFTTYNFTKLKKSFADKQKVNIVMENRSYKLTIDAHRKDATLLASPIQGFMDGRIEESMTSELHVKLIDKKADKIILDDLGRNAGLEVAGNIEEIMV